MSPAVTVSSDLPPGVDVKLFLKHGFYQHKNKLYFKTGKTELAACMLHFFGNAHPGPNINNTTKPALADHVARFSNALCHIDEYKNNLEYEKIEFLKGIWAVLLASFRTLKDKLHIPFDYENFLQLTSDLVLRQDKELGRTDEVAGFWETLGYLVKGCLTNTANTEPRPAIMCSAKRTWSITWRTLRSTLAECEAVGLR